STCAMRSSLMWVRDWGDVAYAVGYRPTELSRRCRTSVRTLERFSQRSEHKPLEEWLRELRLRRALILLRSGATVKVVAAELSYKQCSHFSRQFKAFYGLPPSEISGVDAEVSI